MYGGRLLKAYGASMDAQRCANSLKSLKQWFSFRNSQRRPCLLIQSRVVIIKVI